MSPWQIKTQYPDQNENGGSGGMFSDESGRYNGKTGIFNIISPEQIAEDRAARASGAAAEQRQEPSSARPSDEQALSIDPNEEQALIYRPVSERKPIEVTKLMDDAAGEIVIDDAGIKHKLNSYERWLNRRRKREANAPKRAKLLRAWGYISPVLAVLTALLLTALILRFAAGYINRRYLMPVDPNDPTPVTVTIPSGSGASTIAKILYEAGGEDEPGLISHKAVFKVYVDFKGKSGSLKAGTYVLSRNMSVKQIVDIICTGNPPAATVKFTVAEGMTAEVIAERLTELGVIASPDRFLELCRTGGSFGENYLFIKSVMDEDNSQRPYLLEGYLFPDTYEVFVDASEEDIINKMLTRFADVYSKEYTERAEELGLSMDDVIVLASMIEKEAKTFDFTRVSAVFRNRLLADMPLGSDATLEYIFKTGSLELTPEQLADKTPYNTHLYKGLPAGPISNPGAAAIEAVLYPDEQYMEEGYLYFCLMDPATGALVFARTEEEHLANVEKYKPNW